MKLRGNDVKLNYVIDRVVGNIIMYEVLICEHARWDYV